MAVERTNLWPLRFGASRRNRSLGLAGRNSSAPRLRPHSPSQSRPSATYRSQSGRSLAPARASFLRQLHQPSQPPSPLGAIFKSRVALPSALRGELSPPYRLSCRRSSERSRSHAGPLSAPQGASYRLQSLLPLRAPSRRSTSSSVRVGRSAAPVDCLDRRPRRLSSLLTAPRRSAPRAVRFLAAPATAPWDRLAVRSRALRSQPQSEPRLKVRMVA